MDFLQGKTLLQQGEVSVSADVVLKKKNLILYYFTISDNEPCRVFDEKLYDVYEQAMLRKVEIGIVTVPCDSDQESFLTNIKNHYMNWHSVQFGDELIHYFSSILLYNYGISHVPALVVVRKNGTLVTKSGVKDIEEIGINVFCPTWRSVFDFYGEVSLEMLTQETKLRKMGTDLSMGKLMMVWSNVKDIIEPILLLDVETVGV